MRGREELKPILKRKVSSPPGRTARRSDKADEKRRANREGVVGRDENSRRPEGVGEAVHGL